MTATAGVDSDQRANTCTAIALGWQTAALYVAACGSVALRTEQSDDDSGPDNTEEPLGLLGGRGSLSLPLAAKVSQLAAGVRRLEPLLDEAGVGTGVEVAVKALMDADLDQAKPDVRKAKIVEFNDAAIAALTAADFRVGKGYTVGRKLANMSRPDPKNSKLQLVTPNLASAFPDPGLRCDLEKLLGWVNALRSVLPDHAAKPVIDSARSWQLWMEYPQLQDGGVCDLANQVVREEVARAISAQGRLWRTLLSGEKSSLDLLSSQNYFDSAQQMISIYKRMASSFIRNWYPYLLATLATVIVLIGLLVRYANGTAGAVGAVVTALAAVGVTAKTAATALSKSAGSIGKTLLDSEIDSAAGLAATILPYTVDPLVLKSDTDATKEKAAKEAAAEKKAAKKAARRLTPEAKPPAHDAPAERGAQQPAAVSLGRGVGVGQAGQSADEGTDASVVVQGDHVGGDQRLAVAE